ncbi:3-deoxy-D-manno-octulosonic acid transferase [Pelosinus fermentans]|uniref:3-deoxy-D-manno-octulosonic acid transferase n=1 Tax=Pelosinus fermentans JBW45 TaxID=1192197 RepID=I9NNF9_9FIRM|nr:3-deoxy-D-manno-octulosonic acid transferase [Pelosinus fermentans]AJQ25965.1 Three-deoxy-D-manno-octulosonic-acid transferase domain-containing protein [Pelosinus fermentans JBW45]
MHFLYNLLVTLLVVLAAPVFLFRFIREEGFGRRLRQSFGFIPEEELAPVLQKDCIWLHAASVGEIVAASPIIKEISNELPDKPILISVVTSSGYDMAKRIIKDADSIIFFPLDLPYLSHSVVKRVRPSVFLLVETELWPNFLKAARHFSIPVMMVNGRISDKSVERYHYMRSILKSMLNTVEKFCMQSTIDAQYIIRLGADVQRVVVTGNTKFDQTYTNVTLKEQQTLRQGMGIEESVPVLVAGSTHPGEEEMLLTAFQKVRESYPSAKLLIAPRDIIRSEEIVNLAATYGFKGILRTKFSQQSREQHDIIVLDTIGELGKVYSIGVIIYVGGSLVPRGGHNILEPAAHGKSILVGPHMFNFKETYALFSGRQACVTVYDAETLGTTFLELLNNEELRLKMSQETLTIIEENRGASRKSVMYLKELLGRIN